jgi:hypothetical protein
MDSTIYEASERLPTAVAEARDIPHLAGHLEAEGWLVLPDAIPASLLDETVGELDRSLALRDEIRRANRVEGNYDGTMHHLLGDHGVYVDLLARYEHLDPLLRWYFSGNYILNSYGGVLNRRSSRAYVHQVHRDIRFAASSKRFMLNSLVMLDDFTLDNGATHLLTGSHRLLDRPTNSHFHAESARATGRRGSILFFDSRIWHAAGTNLTDMPRRALTLTFTSPFFKQQFDYPRMMGHDRANSFSPFLRQVIGYNSRVPATLADYYVPMDKRFYQRGQDDDA